LVQQTGALQISERVAIPLGFLATVAVVIWAQRMRKKLKQRNRESWYISDGYVESAKVTAVTAEYIQCEISYSYGVAGQSYGGCFRLNCSDEQGAWDILKPFEGKRVQVRFDPRNPTKSAVAEFDNLEVHGGLYVR
jgi:hypothetical protein